MRPLFNLAIGACMGLAGSVIAAYIINPDLMLGVPRECPGNPIAVIHHESVTYCQYTAKPYSLAITSSKAKRQGVRK